MLHAYLIIRAIEQSIAKIAIIVQMNRTTIKLIHELKFFSIAAIAFVAFHMTLNRSVELWYLPWNLFLAWVPLLIAMHLVTTPLHRYLARGLLIAWLAFLPNTFYVLTDIIHINDQIRFNQTYDVLTFMITAVASFLIGLASLYLIDEKYLSKLGHDARRAIFVAIAIACGVAIYIGRELRWNSWDLVAHPYQIISDLARIVTSPETLAQLALTVLGYTVLILLTYKIFRRLKS